MNRQRLVAGLSLIAFPLAVQVPFTLLIRRFSYPDILLRGADEVLTRFHAGGSEMVWTWYLYALCTLGLGFVATLLPDALGQHGPIARSSVVSGVIAALVQLFGLLRWVLVVPFITMLGEHVGPLFMAVWTTTASLMLLKAHAPKVIAVAGFVSAVLFLAGLGSGLSRAVPMPAFVQPLPMVAFIVWSVWALATGVLLVVRARAAAGARMGLTSAAS